MRLIDADVFVQQVAAMTVSKSYPERKACALCKLIEAQPTAYDVDAVIEQIEEAKHQIFLRDDELEIYMSAMDDAIEIVQCKTVEECRSIRNKELPKQPNLCPNCGQKLDWSTNSEEAERGGEVNHEQDKS